MELPERYRPDGDPEPATEAVVRGPDYRFTVLTSRVIRLEYDPDGEFEDRPSQGFWNRNLPVPAFCVEEDGDVVTVETDHLRLEYDRSGRGFRPGTPSVTLLDADGQWSYGDEGSTLGGAVRTLDDLDGATALEDGLVSRDGWTVVDDSGSLVFGDDGWVRPRDAHDDYEDRYVFGYGDDYRACIEDFTAVTGRPPLVPRWALGNWWSRYWEYSQGELRELMTEFRDRDLPLSVCVVDMDWHVVDNEHHRGWTGWTWNEDLFPDPGGFVDWLHDNDLRTCLNLHPAKGVHPHEDQYDRFARSMGLDPGSGEPVEFDAADPAFLAGYFEHVIHPMEDEEGIDFWWIDWQQWEESSGMAGLDPLWALNHLHALDRTRTGRRPFLLSRWSGLGSHRYPAGFSGDHYVSWESLRFQPYLTATSANVAYGFWSHDVGGHWAGAGDPREFGEQYARWLQFGVLSPVNRIHTTKDRFIDKRPWTFEPTVAEALADGLRLRHALVPYLYTMARRHHETGHAPVEPMYYDHPGREPAYHCPQQYWFGTELVAAPHVRPRGPATNLSRRSVWLPEGDWFDAFSGDHHDGGWHARYGDLSDVPAYAPAGAIIPLGPDDWGIVPAPERLRILAFPGADGEFALYEDEGVGLDHRDGEYATTELTQSWEGDALELEVGPATGETDLVPDARRFEVRIRGVVDPGEVVVDGPASTPDPDYDPETSTLTVDLDGVPTDETVTVRLATDRDSLIDRQDDPAATVERRLRSLDCSTMAKRAIADRLADDPADLSWIDDLAVSLEPAHVRAVVEAVHDVGYEYLSDADRDRIVLYNGEENPAFTYRLSVRDPVNVPIASEWTSRGGPIPSFEVVELADLADRDWELSIRYGDCTVATFGGDRTTPGSE